MFGSKIRTWMENHIGRSKRKGNKKNGNPTQPEKLSQNGAIKGHFLSPTSASDSQGTIGSPRRCEVSPIQNHKSSRKGWQSPDSSVAPKLDYTSRSMVNNKKNSVSSPVIRVTSVPTPRDSLSSEHMSHSSTISNYKRSKAQSNTFSTMKSFFSSSSSPHHKNSDRISSISSTTVSSMSSLHPSMYDPRVSNKSSDSLNSNTTFGGDPRRFSGTSSSNSERGRTYILENSHFQKPPPYFNGGNNNNNYSTMQAGETTLNNNSNSAGPTSRTMGRLNGNHLLPHYTPHGAHPHMTNALSSPESAYSTGYSTDGTSPNGCTNTSECYYVNIRTGTHYFPKGNGNQLENGNRFKCGLNRIDEKYPESEQATHGHRRIESYDASYSLKSTSRSQTPTNFKPKVAEPYLSSPLMNRSYYRSIESPSPRQRCRIRTNPWLSESVSIPVAAPAIPPKPEKEPAASVVFSDKHLGKVEAFSESDTTSSTEKQMTRKAPAPLVNDNSVSEARSKSRTITGHESDEDATLNEVLGKFDESYVYEKETDILSDSDHTDCVSDFDTGQDAGDEFDTDDLLDFDFIDTGSVQEVSASDKYSNTGSCSYHAIPQRPSKLRKSNCRGDECSKRKKKRTRKKPAKATPTSNSQNQPPRGCRSVGGTPVSLRRNEKMAAAPLSNRSNSLTFTEVHQIHNRMTGLSTSERALLKADLEADFKYKQLIHEAEKILVNMKSSMSPSVLSPRRICNLPTNKRVEMLRNDEVDLKREMSKNASKKDENPSEGVIVNKRLEIIKHDGSSVPSSPRSGRASPLKTHVSNFMSQNPDELKKVKSPLPSMKIPSSSLGNARFESTTDSESDASRRPRPPPRASKPPMPAFRSVDMGYTIPDIFYCPQSEPLKRKVYACSNHQVCEAGATGSSITPYKMSRAKKEPQNGITTTDTGSSYDRISNSSELETSFNFDFASSRRQQLIMSTIEDIKRSLLDQSIELNGIHDSDT